MSASKAHIFEEPISQQCKNKLQIFKPVILIFVDRYYSMFSNFFTENDIENIVTEELEYLCDSTDDFLYNLSNAIKKMNSMTGLLRIKLNIRSFPYSTIKRQLLRFKQLIISYNNIIPRICRLAYNYTITALKLLEQHELIRELEELEGILTEDFKVADLNPFSGKNIKLETDNNFFNNKLYFGKRKSNRKSCRKSCRRSKSCRKVH